MDVLDQLRHGLRVRVRLEGEPLCHEELFDLLVVGDDPVVNDHKLIILPRPGLNNWKERTSRQPVRVAVHIRGRAMGRPSFTEL